MPIIDQKLLFTASALALLAFALIAGELRLARPAGAGPRQWSRLASRLAGRGGAQLGVLLMLIGALVAARHFGNESAATPLLATGLVGGTIAAWQLSFDNPALMRLAAMAAALAAVWLLS